MFIVKKNQTKEEIVDFLLKNYSITQIVEELAEFIMNYSQPTPKIVISQEDFDAHFRIRGTREDGEKENRGRKPKEQ